MKYLVKWISQRGFANEGAYVYGAIGTFGKSDAQTITTLSKHRTLELARKAAMRREAKDRRGNEACGESADYCVYQTGE